MVLGSEKRLGSGKTSWGVIGSLVEGPLVVLGSEKRLGRGKTSLVVKYNVVAKWSQSLSVVVVLLKSSVAVLLS